MNGADLILAERNVLLRENAELSNELSACKESPGGCGYWREAAKLREQERDRLKERVETLENALRRIRDFPSAAGQARYQLSGVYKIAKEAMGADTQESEWTKLNKDLAERDRESLSPKP